MSAPGLENGLKILDYICENKTASFSELKRELCINGPSLSRFLKTLVDCDYLSKEKRAYIPGYKVRRIAELTDIRENYKNIIPILLEEISAKTENSVIWVEYRMGKRVCVDRIQKENSLAMMEPGSQKSNFLRNPADYIYISTLPHKVREHIFQTKYMEVQDILSEKQCREFLEFAGEEGYIDDMGLINKGCRRIAFKLPLLATHIVVVGMIEGSYTPETLPGIIHTVKGLIKAYC